MKDSGGTTPVVETTPEAVPSDLHNEGMILDRKQKGKRNLNWDLKFVKPSNRCKQFEVFLWKT